MPSISVLASVIEAMREHARASLPIECCGILAASAPGAPLTHAFPLANALASESAFLADPAALIAALRRLRERGLLHRGIYHSHPASENFPSSRDIAMAYYPQCVQFIIAPRLDAVRPVRAFHIREGQVYELRIEKI